MQSVRKLLALGLNELISRDLIALTPSNENSGKYANQGHAFVEVAGQPSVVSWNEIGWEELRISVWWKYDHSKHPQANREGNERETFVTSKPLAKPELYPRFVGVTVSGWLERKTGAYLQGRGSQGIFDTYVRRGEKAYLDALPDAVPLGFAIEGKFHL